MKKTIIYILLVMFIFGVVGIGFFVNAKYKQTLTNIAAAVPERDNGEEDKNAEIIEERESQHPFILLLFGISKRTTLNDPGRADTIMLALVNPESGRIQLISIPRDAYVDIPGYGKNKINAAYPQGGADLLKGTLENWLSINIHGFANINFEGFIDLVNLVGGIKVNVPRDMRYDDVADGTSIDLKKGEQVLDGKNALDFVRFRKSNDGRHSSDYERMERQQQALAELSRKMASIRMIGRINNIMDILSANIKTSLTVDELDTLVKRFYAIDMQGLETTSLQGGGYLINGAWYEIVPEEEIERVQEIINTFMAQTN